MNNTDSTAIQDMITKIPITLYFTETPDRQHALSYIQWLYSNIPQSKTVNQDKLFREVIARELRVISMKTIEIEILIMTALDTISLDDFTLDSDSLVKKVISQNQDKYDLDTMYRVVAQIMTKLPRDLREQVTGEHKLQVFQKVAKFINMEPKLLEKFMSMDTSLNTPVTMDLDSGDYNTLNKKYLAELKKYKDSQPYLNSDSLENIKTLQQNINSTPTNNGILKAQYVDDKPILMKGVNDNQLYYYDESSGTISEIPSNNSSTQIPVTINDLNTILLSNKVKQGDIQNLIDSINNPNPTTFVPNTTQPSGLFSSIGNFFTGGSPIVTSSNAPLITTMPISQGPVVPQFLLRSQQGPRAQQSQQSQQYYSRQQQGPRAQQQGPSSQQQGSSAQQYNSWKQNYGPHKDTTPNDYLWASTPNYTYAQNIYSGLYQQNDTKHDISQKQILDAKLKLLNSTYKHNPSTTKIEGFTNSNSTNITEAELITNMKKSNENIENVAIAFVTIIILLFLLVIFNAIRNKSGLSK